MPDFVPGLELSRRYYFECVEPILSGAYPHLRWSAALLGEGSDVLGYDTEMSMDHDWGPRVQIFLAQEDVVEYIRPLGSALRSALPKSFLGFPTFFGLHDDGTSHMNEGQEGHPKVEFTSFEAFVMGYLGFWPGAEMRAADWLSLPEQKLLGLTSGAVFRDDLDIEATRRRLAYFPHDVWLYLMASQWDRIGEEEHLVGRAGQVGDELGAKLIAARLVRDLMRIGFLLERQYAPYPKWFGTAFSRLGCASELMPLFEEVLAANDWEVRDHALGRAFEAVARLHNRARLTEPIPERCAPFFNRPFSVIHLHGEVSAKLANRIVDPEVRALAVRRRIGSIDTFSDSIDLLCDETRRDVLQSLYLAGPVNAPTQI